MGKNRSWAVVEAPDSHNALTPYRKITFHKVDNDNNFLYPFEDISYLNVSSRYSTARTPHCTIIFRHIFEHGHAATREALLACRTYATHEIKTLLGIALIPFVTSDPVTVGTQKCNQKGDWMLTRDIKVRFSNANFTKTVYKQQRESVRCKERSKTIYMLLTHDGYINPVMIPSGLKGEESEDPLLHKLFISCDTLRGRDNFALHTYYKTILVD